VTKIRKLTSEGFDEGGRGCPITKKKGGGVFFHGGEGAPGGSFEGVKCGRWQGLLLVESNIRVLPASGPLTGHGGADYRHALSW